MGAKKKHSVGRGMRCHGVPRSGNRHADGQLSEEWATVYVDGSYAPNTGRGGWGAWIRSARLRLLACGHIRPDQSGSSGSRFAEAAAISAALMLVKRYDPAATKVLVKTDCQSILTFFTGSKPEFHEFRSRYWARYRSFEAVQFEWVRGHQTDNSRTSYVNDQVDKLANRGRRSNNPLRIVSYNPPRLVHNRVPVSDTSVITCSTKRAQTETVGDAMDAVSMDAEAVLSARTSIDDEQLEELLVRAQAAADSGAARLAQQALQGDGDLDTIVARHACCVLWEWWTQRDSSAPSLDAS